MEKNNSKIRIRGVVNKDYLFLYNLLKERKPRANISHKRMPSYSQHIKFVNSHPYTKWYIIFQKNKKIGSIYLTEMNEI